MATRHAESRSFVQKCVFLAFLFAIQVAGGGEESVYEKLVGSILQTYLRDIFRFGGEVLKFCVKFFDLPQILLQI